MPISSSFRTTSPRFPPRSLPKRASSAPSSAAALFFLPCNNHSFFGDDPGESEKIAHLSPGAQSTAVGVVLHVDGVVHGGGGGVRFFVGSDVRLMLQRGADVVEALEQNFLARRGNFEFEDQTMLVGDGLVRKIDGQRIAFFFFGAREEFVYLLFGERRGQDAV